MQPPQSRYCLAVYQLEYPFFPVAPLDKLWAAVLVLEQLQQELPQVGGGALAGLPLAGNPVRTHFRRTRFLLWPLEGASVGLKGSRMVGEGVLLARRCGGMGVEVGHARREEGEAGNKEGMEGSPPCPGWMECWSE